MPKVPLTGMTANMLSNGLVGRTMDELLKPVVADLIERPALDKPRKISLTFVFVPLGDGLIQCEVGGGCTIPKFLTTPTHLRHDKAAGGLMFNPESAGNPDQKTFSDMHGD